MKTVAKIIAQRGGLEGLKRKHIRIENKPYMPLVIELAGNSPRGRELRGFLRNSVLVSVAHTYVQNGDLGYDPEMEFEVSPDLAVWQPISWRQGDSIRETAWTLCGRLMIDRRTLRELEQFARMWDRNLRDQGFLAAAKGGAVSR